MLAIAALVGVASGCATFSDNDLAAKVGGVELTHAELSDRLADLDNTDKAPERVDGALARGEITEFVRGAVAEQVGLLDAYSQADPRLGVVCFNALEMADRIQADDLVARLAAGESWDQVAESVSPGAADGSRVPCQPVGQVVPEVPAVGELLATLVPGGPSKILDVPELGGAVFVVRPQPADELDIVEFLNAVNAASPELIDGLNEAVADGDVYVDPRFGEFDPAQLSVIPLG